MNVQGRWAVSVSSVVILLAIAIGGEQADAQQSAVVFDNLATNGGLDASGASPASQTDAAFPFDAGAADDFVLPASPQCRWSISGVRWTLKHWGNQNPTQVGSFRIIFWGDQDGAPRSGLSPIPDSALAVASFTVSAAGGMNPNAGVADAFDFEAALPQSLELMPGLRYWIQIQAIAEYPPQWGMHITNGRQGLGPVQYFDLLSMPAWMNVPDDGDLAFRLLGNPAAGSCDDGNACTADSCVNGECTSSVLSCDDGDACTGDSCDPQSGCVHAAMNCGDTDSCTVDSCDNGVCSHIGPPDFDGDGDIDLVDFAVIASCSTDISQRGEFVCQCADLSGDGQIDLRDMAIIQRLRTVSR